MSEQENPIAEQEVQEVAQTNESEAVQQEVVDTQASEKKRNVNEHNWAEARRKMKDLEKQNLDMQEKMSRLEGAKAVQDDDDLGIGDGDLAEGKHVKSLNKELKRLKSLIQEQQISTVDAKLQLKYADYGQVVTTENIEALIQAEPELAESLRHSPDPYQKGVAAYKLLKKLGIGQDAVVPSQEREKANVNIKKPMSVNAVTKQSAIGNAHLFENGLTKELKASLWKEMQETAKRA